MPEERINGVKAKKGSLPVSERERRLEDFLIEEASASPMALERLCDLYIPRIYGYVLKRVGKVPDAEDITSIVFEKVLLNIDTFDRTKASFSTWIYRIALNSVTDFYRVRGRKKEHSLEEIPVNPGFEEPDGIERLDTYMALVELLGELPHKYQEALTLRYFGEMSVLEVAETLRISETAASKRILRGLDKLRKLAATGPLEEFL